MRGAALQLIGPAARPVRGNPHEPDVLDQYLVGIREFELLTAEQEQRLGAAAQQGDPDAVLDLVQHNLRLVVRVARGFRRYGWPMEDLVQDGNLGLIHAAGKFDPARGVRFATYATWWIRQAIQQGVARTADVIRAPRRATRVMAASIDQILENRESPQGFAVDFDFEALEDRVDARRYRCAEAVQALPDRHQAVVRARFGFDEEPRTLRDIARDTGVSPQRVQQIQTEALDRLRRIMNRTNFTT